MSLSIPADGARRPLQVTLAVLGCIPLVTGAVDVATGPDLLPGGTSQVTASLDSEFRFASTFWLAVGPLIWSQLPHIEEDSAVLQLTLGTVFLGGLARLRSWRTRGRPHPVFVTATALELLGMPAAMAWQQLVARRARS